MEAPTFDALECGDLVKVRVGNERLWFEVINPVLVTDGVCNAVVCRLLSEPVEGIVFDGRLTIDRDWIIETMRRVRPKLRLVS